MQTLETFSLSSRGGRYFKTGKGKPIVLLHGFAETYQIWDLVSPALSNRYTLIFPEIPECGNPQSMQREFSMEAIADFVNHILDAERMQQTVLFGHSMGGYAAMAFAEKYPQKLAGLSLVHSSAQADTEDKKQIRQSAIDFILKNGKEQFIKTLIPKLYGTQSGYEKERVKHLSMFEQYTDSQIISCYKAMKTRPDRTNILSQLNIPVQFIGGREDQSINYKDLEYQATLTPNSTLTIFEGIGHTSMHENSLLLIETIIGFLDDIFQTNKS